MPLDTRQIREHALRLPAAERAALAEILLESLDQSDPHIDELWATEAESRIAAFEAGEMEAIPAEDVFREFEQT